jgi:tetratricopeptide (TPR) repeat protein
MHRNSVSSNNFNCKAQTGLPSSIGEKGKSKWERLAEYTALELMVMSEKKEREDPVKMHKDANNLLESGKYQEAKDMFIRTAELYRKSQNFFDSTTMLYKAGECDFALKNYDKAVESFTKSAELSFEKGFDRFGASALDYAKDCYNALGNKKKVEELEKKIKEVKAKLESAF